MVLSDSKYSCAYTCLKSNIGMSVTNKVFCIGFQKTGTTSLGEALEMLGFRVTGVFGTEDPDMSSYVVQHALKVAENYDAFQDFPWAVLYRELDVAFPESKFILTVRPEGEWMASVTKHFGCRSKPMRTWIYGIGYPAGNEGIYLERYDRHNREVVEYFKDRPGDLLVLKLTEGEGWRELCGFLGCSVPSDEFPSSNTSKVRRKRRIRRYMRHPVKSVLGLLRSYARSLAASA